MISLYTQNNINLCNKLLKKVLPKKYKHLCNIGEYSICNRIIRKIKFFFYHLYYKPFCLYMHIFKNADRFMDYIPFFEEHITLAETIGLKSYYQTVLNKTKTFIENNPEYRICDVYIFSVFHFYMASLYKTHEVEKLFAMEYYKNMENETDPKILKKWKLFRIKELQHIKDLYDFITYYNITIPPKIL